MKLLVQQTLSHAAKWRSILAVCLALFGTISIAHGQEFDRVLASFGNLSTVAGTADVDGGGDNGWQDSMEGRLAVNAELSRPHMAMADVAGNIYIADKDAHAIRRINLDGSIQTIAGANSAGFNGDGVGTAAQLNAPNGLFTFADGTTFILDLGNNRIRRLSSDGNLTTIFADPLGISTGRGLWVNADEDEIYYSSANELKKWTPDEGISVVADGFRNLGNITVDPLDGKLVVTDRGLRDVNDGSGHIVFKLDSNGERVAIAGNGATSGGASGASALQVALHEVRAVTYDTTGGFYVGTHRASDVWYVDLAGTIHMLIEGNRDNDTHAGDGQPLSTPGAKISEPRSIALGPNRAMIVVENDGGYVRIAERDALLGDYDYDRAITAIDVDLLTRAVNSETHAEIFNLNSEVSRYVDEEDRRILVEVLAASAFGDTDLNGKVDFTDFLKLSAAFAHQGGWGDGDFDGSGDVGFADFLLLSEEFAANAGQPIDEAVTVPEPDAESMILFFIVCCVLGRCSSTRRNIDIATKKRGFRNYTSITSIKTLFGYSKTLGAQTRLCWQRRFETGSRSTETCLLLQRVTYMLFVIQCVGFHGGLRAEEPTTGAELSDDQLLELVQRQTFRYFYEFGHPDCGLARERSAPAIRGTRGHAGLEDIVTTGGTGFGLMAFPIAVEREWITRPDAVTRLLKIVRFLERAPRFHGMWAHWYMGNTGEVRPFSKKDDGGDIVESAFLLQGLLAVRQFFDGDATEERELRQTITRLWQEADWKWYQNGKSWLHWHWSPNHGFEMNMPIMGFDECMIVYVLAVASPTHAVDASLYDSGWANEKNERFAGRGSYVDRLKIGPTNSGGPLFFSHYSFLGLSPHIKDKYITKAGYRDYAERHRAHNQFCIEWCRKKGYPADCWGLTSSDDPEKGYKSHCAEDGPRGDNGTITPTAALSSIVYTPKESMAFLRFIWQKHREGLWSDLGFQDAFNLRRKWYAPAHLAIDQGPIIVMIENYRSGNPWKRFMSIPEIQHAMKELKFESTKN